MSAIDGLAVGLVDVDELTLDWLVNAAVSDASATEVTALVTTGDDWSSTRIAWLKDFHRNRRDGLAGLRVKSRGPSWLATRLWVGSTQAHGGARDFRNGHLADPTHAWSRGGPAGDG